MQLCNIFIKNKAAVIQSSIHPLSTLATLQQHKQRTRYVQGVSIINGGEKNTGHNKCTVFAYYRVSVIHSGEKHWTGYVHDDVVYCEYLLSSVHWRKTLKKSTEHTQCIPSIYYPVCTNNDERRCQGESTHLSEKGQIQSGHSDKERYFSFNKVLMPWILLMLCQFKPTKNSSGLCGSVTLNRQNAKDDPITIRADQTIKACSFPVSL